MGKWKAYICLCCFHTHEMVTPQKFNIDTKHGHISKEPPFPMPIILGIQPLVSWGVFFVIVCLFSCVRLSFGGDIGKLKCHVSRQFIATVHRRVVTPKRSDCKGILPEMGLNSGFLRKEIVRMGWARQ